MAMKWLMNLVISEPVYLVYMCISHCPGNAGLSGPTMKVFFHVLMNLLTVILFCVFLGFCRCCKSCGEQMIIGLHLSFYYHHSNGSFVTILDDFYALLIYSAVCSLRMCMYLYFVFI